MEAHLNLDRMETDCHNATSLQHCGLENGGLRSNLVNFEVIGGEGETNVAVIHPIMPIHLLDNKESTSVMGASLSSEFPQSPTTGEGFNSEMSDEAVDLGTPKEGIFNPFAPGPDMCLAPCKKLARTSRRIVARRLSFDDVGSYPSSNEDEKNVEIWSEKLLLDTVYETLLEVIIRKLTEDFLAENQDVEIEDCGTPTSPPPLNGIAENFPGAPAKELGCKTLTIDPSFCRKLEY